MSRTLTLLPTALVAVLLGLAPVEGQAAAFPHARHQGLFPLCTGCHAGAVSGDSETLFPPPALCANCHDGQQAAVVVWPGPQRRPTHLKFDHASHADKLAEADGRDPAPACGACHNTAADPSMQVVRAAAELCQACHTHRAADHFADAQCADCHTSLAASGFALERIGRLPKPANHTAGDFLARDHGERARQKPSLCNTCHTQETCTTCHVDPGVAAAVLAQIAQAPAGMALPKTAARYPVPASHRAADFLKAHGAQAATASCATCHTQESCTTCHLENPPAAVGRLVSSKISTAAGVVVQRQPPPSHNVAGFQQNHQGLAAADNAACAACHAPSFCSDCHEPADSPAYHPPNFALRHSAQAFGRQMECAACHNTAAFCRDCHAQLGLKAQGRLDPGFHDKAPAWLLRHGQAARQELDSCASCHRQTDCLQCHSQLGRFRVSPHGPDFDGKRVFKENGQICFACHIGNPLTETQR